MTDNNANAGDRANDVRDSLVRSLPQLMHRLEAIYDDDAERVRKFFRMLEGLALDDGGLHRLVPLLVRYLGSLEKCRELGISERALDLTCRLIDAPSAMAPDVLRSWIEFSDAVYEVNTRSRDKTRQTRRSRRSRRVSHLDAIRADKDASLAKLLDLVALESEERPTSACRLLGHCGPIIELIGYDGLDTVIDYTREIRTQPDQRAQAYLEVLRCSPPVIRGLLTIGDRKFVKDTYRIAGELNRDLSIAECISFLKKTPHITGKIGFDGQRRVQKLYRKIARSKAKRSDVDGEFVLLLEESAGIIDALSLHGGKQLVMDVYGHAERIAKHGPTLTHAFLVNAPALGRIDGLHAIERVSQIISEIAADDLVVPMLMKDLPTVVEALGYNGISGSAALGRRIWEHDGKAALVFIDNIAQHLARLDHDGLSRLADKITEEAITNPRNAELLARGETQEYLDYVDYINEGLHLKHVKQILSNYLGALLGYRIEISPAPSADTDGERVYLPETVRDFEDDARNLLMYKVLATHVEAHIEFGSFDFQISKVSDLVADLKGHYGTRTDADEKASDEQRFFGLFPEPALIEDLKNILEDFRIESRLRGIYPVLGRDILRMHRHGLKGRPSLQELSSDKDRAVEAICQMLYAGKTKEEVPESIAPVLDDALAISAPLRSSHTDVHDTFRAATMLYTRIDETYEEPYSRVSPFTSPVNQADFATNIGNFSKTAEMIMDLTMNGEGDESGDDGMRHPDQQPAATYDPAETDESPRDQPTEDLRQMLLDLFKEKGIKPKDVERAIRDLDPAEVLAYLKSLLASLQEENEDSEKPKRFRYPEWGSDINAYRVDWTTVIERKVTGDDPEFYRKTLESYGGLIKKIRREFQVLRPEALVKLKRQFDGANIDFDAAVDYQIDLMLDITPSEKNYIRTAKHTRDIAVAFLIDLSGSTIGNTIKCEKQSLVMLSEALSELRDTFGIFGFTGYTKDRVDFYIIKDFAEVYDAAIKQRISGLTPGFNTREGAAIRHVTSKLKVREEKTRILILLNDSQPFDEGYLAEYAIADTRKAIYEAKRDGIKPFCLTTAKDNPNLKELYSHNSWVVIDDVTKLPEKITRIYRKLTT